MVSSEGFINGGPSKKCYPMPLELNPNAAPAFATDEGIGSHGLIREASAEKKASWSLDVPQEGENHIDFTLRKVAQLGHGQQGAREIRRLLNAKAEPNRSFPLEPVRFHKGVFTLAKRKKTFHGPPLIAAVLRGELGMIKALLEHRADITGPKAQYRFTAGLRKVEMVSPPLFAVCRQGDPRILRELLRVRAQIEEMATLDGKEEISILWSACYHGQFKVVRELLHQIEARAEEDFRVTELVEKPALHQDNADLSYTPLHIACREGHVDIVKELIAFQANTNTYNGCHSILTEAIDRDRQEVVRALVASMADILSDESCDWLFHQKNNMVTIVAAAEGLRLACDDGCHDVEEYIAENLTSKKLVKFLNTPGDANIHIVNVMFRDQKIGKLTRTERVTFRHAHVANGNFNACKGPTSHFFPVADEFEHCPRFLNFMDELMPGVNRDDCHLRLQESSFLLWCCGYCRGQLDSTPPMKVPVDVYHCMLKGIYHNPEVLIAIAETDNDCIFQHFGVQAILSLGWKNSQIHNTMQAVTNLLFALTLLYVARDFNDEDGMSNGSSRNWMLSLCKWLLVLIFLYTILCEIEQILGYSYMNKLDVYVRDGHNWLDWMRLVLTGFTVGNIVWNDDAIRKGIWPNSPTVQRLCFALTAFLRWIKVLYSLRGYEWTGRILLPVLKVLPEAYPFMFVVCFPAIGFMHAYYIYGVYGKDLFRSFTIMYRVGFVGDFDLEEMEDIDSWFSAPNHTDTGTEVDIEDPLFTHWRATIVFTLIAVTLWVTITMMNIFIAVLSESYNKAFALRDQMFWRTRARIVLDSTFKLRVEADAIRCISRLLCKTRCFISGSTVSMVDASDWEYVWYCQPQAEAVEAADGELNPDTYGVHHEHERHKEFEEVRIHMRSVKNNVHQLKYGMNELLTRIPQLAPLSLPHAAPDRHGCEDTAVERNSRCAVRRSHSAPAEFRGMRACPSMWSSNLGYQTAMPQQFIGMEPTSPVWQGIRNVMHPFGNAVHPGSRPRFFPCLPTHDMDAQFSPHTNDWRHSARVTMSSETSPLHYDNHHHRFPFLMAANGIANVGAAGIDRVGNMVSGIAGLGAAGIEGAGNVAGELCAHTTGPLKTALATLPELPPATGLVNTVAGMASAIGAVTSPTCAKHSSPDENGDTGRHSNTLS